VTHTPGGAGGKPGTHRSQVVRVWPDGAPKGTMAPGWLPGRGTRVSGLESDGYSREVDGKQWCWPDGAAGGVDRARLRMVAPVSP